MRLLVVEDEPRISELIKAALQRADFVVDTVRVRADAREALANTPYDAVILDLGLPDGDGLDLLAELRPAGKHIPILILTHAMRWSTGFSASTRGPTTISSNLLP